MAETKLADCSKCPEIELPKDLSWQKILDGNPEEPVFGGESRWPTKGMLRIMGNLRKLKPIESKLKDYCQILPGKEKLMDIINSGYDSHTDSGWEGLFANWLASEGGNQNKVNGEPEAEPLVRKFMVDYGKPTSRSFARQEFIVQLLNQLMPETF